MGEGAPKPRLESGEENITEAKRKLGDTLRTLYNEMKRGMELSRRLDITERMDKASTEAIQAGVTEKDIKEIREEARKQAVRDDYEKDVREQRQQRRGNIA